MFSIKLDRFRNSLAIGFLNSFQLFFYSFFISMLFSFFCFYFCRICLWYVSYFLWYSVDQCSLNSFPSIDWLIVLIPEHFLCLYDQIIKQGFIDSVDIWNWMLIYEIRKWYCLINHSSSASNVQFHLIKFHYSWWRSSPLWRHKGFHFPLLFPFPLDLFLLWKRKLFVQRYT